MSIANSLLVPHCMYSKKVYNGRMNIKSWASAAGTRRFWDGPRPVLPIERWVCFVHPEPNSGCWLWLGAVNPVSGYGTLGVNGKNKYAHVFAYQHFKGPIPTGREVDHVCRVRCCVNPDHLRVATRQQNLAGIRKYRGTSRYKGVSWDKNLRNWRARINFQNREIQCGSFATEEEAARAYDAKARELNGDFARVNFA